MELYPEDDQELYSYMSYEERKMHERLIEYALERILIKDVESINLTYLNPSNITYPNLANLTYARTSCPL